MRILIAAIGKLKDAEERAISERYAKRFTGAGRRDRPRPGRNTRVSGKPGCQRRRTQTRRGGTAVEVQLPPISSLRSIRRDDRSAAKPSPPCWAGSAMTALKPARF